MNRSQKRGFTLAELMVVISIIALLAAIILPFFAKAVAIQRRVNCANNLQKIGQAYSTRDASVRMLGRRDYVRAQGWIKSLAEYAGDSGPLFQCPEDPGAETVDPMDVLKSIYIEVYTSGTPNRPGAYQWKVYIDEAGSSEWLWRLSTEQWEDLRDTPGHGVNYTYTGYSPGSDSSRWWFVFEDQGWKGGGDKDYWDQMVEVRQTDTEMQLIPHKGAAGYNFSLCRDPNREVLSPDMKIDDLKQISVECSMASSYGMNSVSNRIDPGTNRLLVLDYRESVAVGSQYAQSIDRLRQLDYWEEANQPKGLPRFARHFEKCNVLFANGQVQLLAPSEINPNDLELVKKHWNPREDR